MLQAHKWMRPVEAAPPPPLHPNISLLSFNVDGLNVGFGPEYDLANIQREWHFSVGTIELGQGRFGSGAFNLTIGLGPQAVNSSPHSSLLANTDTDFTIETWVKPTGFYFADSYFWHNRTHALFCDQSGRLHLLDVYSPRLAVGSHILPLDEWVHIAMTRKSVSNQWRVFVNGELSIFDQSLQPYARQGEIDYFGFGGGHIGTEVLWQRMVGFVDEAVIYIGKCLYTEDFTPRQAPWTVEDLLAAPAL